MSDRDAEFGTPDESTAAVVMRTAALTWLPMSKQLWEETFKPWADLMKGSEAEQ